MLLWVKLAVAVILIGVLFSFVDWRESLHLLSDVELVPTVAAAALLAVGVALSTLEWQVLLVAHGIRLPILRLLQYYWIGSFFSNFLPSNVGGDIVCLSLMYRQESLAVIGASILVERLVGLFVLLFLSAIGLLVLSRHFTESDVLLPMCLLILGMSSGLRVDVALIAPLIALVSFVPISINALGLAESAFVLFFTQAGLSAEQALAAAVLRRVLMTGYSLLGGLFWLRERPRLRPAQ